MIIDRFHLSLLCLDKLIEYNKWLEDATQSAESFGRVYQIPHNYGFVMAFRKDHPLFSYKSNILLRAAPLFGQGTESCIVIYKC